MRFVLAALLVVAATACKHNKHGNTTVQARAMFDFACPQDKLTLRVVDTEGARKMASQIAAYGCGKKAVYAYFPDADTWLINGAVSEMPSEFEVPANVTKGKDRKRADKQASKAERRGKMNSDAPTPDEPAPVEPAPVDFQAPAGDVSDSN